MLTCKQATELVSQGLDRRLGLSERLALRVHLMICSGCRNARRQFDFLRRSGNFLRNQTFNHQDR